MVRKKAFCSCSQITISFTGHGQRISLLAITAVDIECNLMKVSCLNKIIWKSYLYKCYVYNLMHVCSIDLAYMEPVLRPIRCIKDSLSGRVDVIIGRLYLILYHISIKSHVTILFVLSYCRCHEAYQSSETPAWYAGA